MEITIFGKGNMGQAIAKNLANGDHQITLLDSSSETSDLGELVILAVPYPALATIAEKYQKELKGKVVVDISNPLNFETWDGLVVPADSSAAEQLQALLPESTVLKAFNTNFASTLATGKIGNEATTVLVAGDSAAKQVLITALTGSSLQVRDAGALKRARELEATGFLQMTLAANEQIGWTGGFATIK